MHVGQTRPSAIEFSKLAKDRFFKRISFLISIFIRSAISTLVLYFELFFCIPFLVFNECFLGNRVDCILAGIRNGAEAKSEQYRELVRNTCGMFGVPPNYVRFTYGNNFFFMRVPPNYYSFNQSNYKYLQNVPKNETFIGTADYFRIRHDEELDRKCLVLAFSFLLFLQLFMILQVVFCSLRFVNDHFFAFILFKILKKRLI